VKPAKTLSPSVTSSLGPTNSRITAQSLPAPLSSVNSSISNKTNSASGSGQVSIQGIAAVRTATNPTGQVQMRPEKKNIAPSVANTKTTSSEDSNNKDQKDEKSGDRCKYFIFRYKHEYNKLII
jgi:hypothetical protein